MAALCEMADKGYNAFQDENRSVIMNTKEKFTLEPGFNLDVFLSIFPKYDGDDFSSIVVLIRCVYRHGIINLSIYFAFCSL